MTNSWLTALETLDIEGLSKWWSDKNPHLPQPTPREALVTAHMARTAADSVAFKLRAYSHRWLVDNGYPSQMPDRLKPRAERIYPTVTTAVGISVNAKAAWMKPAATQIRNAMEDAVLEAESDGKLLDAAHVSARMDAARAYTIDKLFA